MTHTIKNIIPTVKKTGFYVFAILVVLLESLYLIRSIPRQWEQIKTLQKSQNDFTLEVTKLSHAVDVLNNLDRKKLALQLANVNAALPSQKKTSGFVSGISAIASGSGVILKEVDFSPGRISTDSAQVVEVAIKGTNARSVAASVTVNSDLLKLINFLTNLQKANQLIGISDINYSTTAKENLSQISLNVYYQLVSGNPIDWGQVRPNSQDENKTIESISNKDVFTLPQESH